MDCKHRSKRTANNRVDRTQCHGNGLSCRIKTLLVCLLLAALSGCTTLDRIVQKPTATFSGFGLTDATLWQGTALFHFDVHNPNPIGIRANRVKYDLKINGKDFVSGKLDQGISLAAGTTSPMSIPVTLQYMDFFGSMEQLWRQKKADYDLSGGFAVGPFMIPFRAQGSFDLPRMPNISLDAIQIKSLSLLGASLSCKLKMDNPNAFDILFKRLDYHLNLGGTAFAQASAVPKSPIQSGKTTLLDLGFDVSFTQLGQSAYQLLMGNRTQYAMDGGLVFDAPGGERKIPFNLSGRMPFER